MVYYEFSFLVMHLDPVVELDGVSHPSSPARCISAT